MSASGQLARSKASSNAARRNALTRILAELASLNKKRRKDTTKDLAAIRRLYRRKWALLQKKRRSLLSCLKLTKQHSNCFPSRKTSPITSHTQCMLNTCVCTPLCWPQQPSTFAENISAGSLHSKAWRS